MNFGKGASIVLLKKSSAEIIKLALSPSANIIKHSSTAPLKSGSVNWNFLLPSKKTIEKEMDSYVESTLPYCIYEYDFPDLNITQEEASSKSKIYDNYVSFSAKAPVSVKKGDKTFTIDREYDVKIPIKLGEIYDIADLIIDKEIENPNYISLSYLAELDYDILFNLLIVLYFDDETVFILKKYNKSKFKLMVLHHDDIICPNWFKNMKYLYVYKYILIIVCTHNHNSYK